MRHNQRLKTAGPQTAHLIAALHDRAQTTFTNSDVKAITGLEATSARSLVRNAEARGLVTRLKPGLFVLVPPELGSATEFSGNPYLTARAMVGGATRPLERPRHARRRQRRHDRCRVPVPFQPLEIGRASGRGRAARSV